MNHIKTIILISLFLCAAASGALLNPVSWKASLDSISDREYVFTATATINRGWHIYDTTYHENGPVPTTISFKKTTGVTLIGPLTASAPARVTFDSTFKLTLGSFEKHVRFTQRIAVKDNKPVTITATIQNMACNDVSCLPPADTTISFKVTPHGQVAPVAPPPPEPVPVKPQHRSLFGFFILAFIAGLLAILTPCVFPMVPLTVSYFIKKDAHGRTAAPWGGILYGLAIIVIYVVIGTVISVTLGANFANFLSTHWLPNILFFLVFTVFALSFFGLFEITLPSWLVNSANKKAYADGFFRPVFMAFTLVAVSFSCTGPLVGTILVQAAQGEIILPIVGMFGFSLAFALPFSLLSIFPQFIHNLPKSGSWLNTVKVLLGFIELALGLKFLSVADQAYHWNFLSREIYLAIWIVITFLCGLYLLGKIRLPNDDDMAPKTSVLKLVLSILVFSFGVYLIPGLFGAPLAPLAGYLPPQSTMDFNLMSLRNDSGTASTKNNGSYLCDAPKYGDLLHFPLGLQGYFDYEQALACAKKVNKPLFIDFTGHGCVNCREMESRVWSDKRVLDILRDRYVLLALYVDDKTELPKNEWIVSSYDHKTKTSIGKKNADFQIQRFSINAQPYYVLLDTNEQLLVEPRAYNLNAADFARFLETGLKTFTSRK